jgi:phage repressor protein C with HTH and peptisase S24 domain
LVEAVPLAHYVVVEVVGDLISKSAAEESSLEIIHSYNAEYQEENHRDNDHIDDAWDGHK